MNSRADFQTCFCSEYELLLHRCEETRESCAQWRASMNSANSPRRLSKDVIDELLRLQARYAKAYSRLEAHYKQCERCQFARSNSAGQSILADLSTGTEHRRPS